MSNQPDVNNVQRAIRVPRVLDAKVLKKFQLDDMTVKDAYILALDYATMGVDLDDLDHIKIAQDIKAAKLSVGKIPVRKTSAIKTTNRKTNNHNTNK